MDVGSKATGRSRAATAGEGSHELRQAEEQLAARHVSAWGVPAVGKGGSNCRVMPASSQFKSSLHS